MRLPLENAEQIALVSWLRARHILFTHVANERRCSAREGARLKAMGVRPGCPDLILFTPPPKNPLSRGVFIEMKRRNGGTHNLLQESWKTALIDIGWVGGFFHGASDAVSFLKSLGYDRVIP